VDDAQATVSRKLLVEMSWTAAVAGATDNIDDTRTLENTTARKNTRLRVLAHPIGAEGLILEEDLALVVIGDLSRDAQSGPP
jgi:hypothetical protein